MTDLVNKLQVDRNARARINPEDDRRDTILAAARSLLSTGLFYCHSTSIQHLLGFATGVVLPLLGNRLMGILHGG